MLRRLSGAYASSGITCVVLAMMALSLQDGLVKWLGATFPLHQIVLTRAVVAIVLIGVALLATARLHQLRTRRWRLHLARGLLLVVANSTFFLAVVAMPLANAVAIFFVAPLFITLLSARVLGEPVGPRRLAAVAIGFAGVLVMVRPGSEVFHYTAVLPVVAALAYATMQILTRRLGTTDGAASMAFYVHATFIVAGVAMGLAVGDGRFAGDGDPSLEFLLRAWRPPGGRDLLLLGLVALLITAATLLLGQAYRITQATTLAPFEYVALPFATLWGLLFFGEVPDATAVAGMAMIVASGLFVIHRTKRVATAIPTVETQAVTPPLDPSGPRQAEDQTLRRSLLLRRSRRG